MQDKTELPCRLGAPWKWLIGFHHQEKLPAQLKMLSKPWTFFFWDVRIWHERNTSDTLAYRKRADNGSRERKGGWGSALEASRWDHYYPASLRLLWWINQRAARLNPVGLISPLLTRLKWTGTLADRTSLRRFTPSRGDFLSQWESERRRR